MHHRRKSPRSTRSGCKMCKPWKKNGQASRGSVKRVFAEVSGTMFDKRRIEKQ
jgi:hypothetical protein